MLNSENILLKFAFFLSLILKLFFYFSRLFYQELTSKLQIFLTSFIKSHIFSIGFNIPVQRTIPLEFLLNFKICLKVKLHVSNFLACSISKQKTIKVVQYDSK